MTREQVVTYRDADDDCLEVDTRFQTNAYFLVNGGMAVAISRAQAKLIRKQLKQFIKAGEEQDV